MNLRHLVPALGILATTSAGLFAENVGGLAVGGFVDTIGTIANTQDDHDDASKSFSSSAELRLGYKIGDTVTAQIDMEWNNSTASDTDLEQAFISWAVIDQVTFNMGKATSYAGWTAADADGLYRVNASPIVTLYTSDVIGGWINYAPIEGLVLSGYLVNGLFAQGGADTAYNDAGNKAAAIAVDAVYTLTDVGSFNVEVGYDPRNGDRSVLAIAGNTTINLASYKPLTIGAELMLNSYKNDDAGTDGNVIGFMLMGNHTLTVLPFPASVTGMVTLLQAEAESGVDLGAGTADDSSNTEVAVALLTSPTGDSRFGLNAELAYEIASSDAAGSDDMKTVSFSLEGIAIIP